MKIAYLLHRFPGKTDTFIKREIECLQKLGLDIQIISVWSTWDSEGSDQSLKWSKSTTFLLPKSPHLLLLDIVKFVVKNPLTTFNVFQLVVNTSGLGIKNSIYQFLYFAEAILAANIIKSRNISHIHNHFGDQSGNVAMFAAALSNIEYSISYHGPHIFFDPQRWALPQKIRNAKFSRAISYFCRSQLMLFAGITEPTNINIVHCGIDLQDYNYRPPRDKVLTLFTSCRLAPEKGLTILILALSQLRDEGLKLELRIAGDGVSYHELKTYAQELDISNQVKFLGYMNDSEVRRELDSSDIFVLPSFAEGLPVSLMEAMAIGVPVIATNIAAVSELIENGKSGILIQPSNVSALTKSIKLLATNNQLAYKVSKAGRKVIQQEFDIVQECQKLKLHFESN